MFASEANPRVRIGIINNMPDAALRSTERQFGEIIAAAGQNLAIDVKWFALQPSEMRQHYLPIEALWQGARFDGLIVTGTEPRAASLADEPYWTALTKTIEWASRHASSVVWSCLAAHAAVLHLDGVERQSRARKVFGTFEGVQALRHPLMAEVAVEAWRVPHSRWNDLPEPSLAARGYQTLVRSADAGVDVFMKAVGASLFVFCQSHPEYDARALMREYRRDVLVFLKGEREQYPEVPQNYFDLDIEAALDELGREAVRSRSPDIMPVMQGLIGKANLTAGWRPGAVQFYKNWLRSLLDMPLSSSLVVSA